MSVAQAARTFTPDDLLRMPDSSTKELVDGQIVEKNVSAESSEIENLIGAEIRIYLKTNPIAKVYSSSLGYRCFNEAPDKVRKPDVSVILRERLAELAEPDPGYMPIAPDLAVEVVSPNDLVYEVDEKITEYLDAGFPLIWVADPRAKTVTVYSRGGRPAIFSGDDLLTADTLLPGFARKVREFFPEANASRKAEPR